MNNNGRELKKEVKNEFYDLEYRKDNRNLISYGETATQCEQCI
jgi:hypothetical protein